MGLDGLELEVAGVELVSGGQFRECGLREDGLHEFAEPLVEFLHLATVVGQDSAAGLDELAEFLLLVVVEQFRRLVAADKEDRRLEPFLDFARQVDDLPAEPLLEGILGVADEVGGIARVLVPVASPVEFVDDKRRAALGQEQDGKGGFDGRIVADRP